MSGPGANHSVGLLEPGNRSIWTNLPTCGRTVLPSGQWWRLLDFSHNVHLSLRDRWHVPIKLKLTCWARFPLWHFRVMLDFQVFQSVGWWERSSLETWGVFLFLYFSASTASKPDAIVKVYNSGGFFFSFFFLKVDTKMWPGVTAGADRWNVLVTYWKYNIGYVEDLCVWLSCQFKIN